MASGLDTVPLGGGVQGPDVSSSGPLLFIVVQLLSLV